MLKNTDRQIYILLAAIFLFVACTSLLSACGSADNDHGFGVTDDLEANQDDFIRPQFGSTTDVDPVFPDGTNPPPPSSGSGSGSSTGSSSGSSSSSTSSSRITFFLWKPESERDGNLAVLVNVPNVEIIINGSTSLPNSSVDPRNGTTGRGSKEGCDYGDDVEVTFRDRFNRPVLLRNGQDSVTIEDGCERVEFTL